MHIRTWRSWRTRRTWAALFLLAALLALPGALMGETSANAATVAPAAQTPGNSADTNGPGKDSVLGPATGTVPGTPLAADTVARSKSRADTVLVVKHSFNHREQIITGSVVMTCLALMLVVMNNYNPR